MSINLRIFTSPKCKKSYFFKKTTKFRLKDKDKTLKELAMNTYCYELNEKLLILACL